MELTRLRWYILAGHKCRTLAFTYEIEMGHKIGSSVSKKTTCLVVKEKGLGTIKEKKAEQYGIPVLTFEEFKEKFNV